MITPDRRNFLQFLGAGAAAAALPASIDRALAIPANTRTHSIKDVEHIVIMMQENRSFDHYFGSLRGVRGFGDPRAVTLLSGKSVWHQQDGGTTVLPFHPEIPNLGLVFLEDLPHDWNTTHAAWNNGFYDQWVPNKGATTMAFLKRGDIPFHYALADAFTVCDAYHCALLGPTDPNRYHMWTGWVGNDGNGGGPVVDNAEAGYSWSTYPERLQDAGISEGLTQAHGWGFTSDAYIGNYGDNSLLYFKQYQDAQPGSPLYQGALTGTNVLNGGGLFDMLRADIANGALPQVSWIVAPEAFTEHPNWPANYGAYYVSQVLDALTSAPDVWSKTAFFLVYDENDGFFDHVVPPTPPGSAGGLSTVPTTNEYFFGTETYPAGPYGLGVRVPMVVISPWSRGGYVNSQVFDHTSLIRFIEARFGGHGLRDSNITPWRRAVSGDLTSAFNFTNPNSHTVKLPDTSGYAPPNANRYPSYTPPVPAHQHLPRQEPGVRPARALPYVLDAKGSKGGNAGSFDLSFSNKGSQAAVFQVRSGLGALTPRAYTVGSKRHLADSWPTATGAAYDLSVYGPNGFYRAFKGRLTQGRVLVDITCMINKTETGLTLLLTNHGQVACSVAVQDQYTQGVQTAALQPGDSVSQDWDASAVYGWYDLVATTPSDTTYLRQLAGHIENGQDSITDPAIGAG
jgi:phospholipase C